MAELIVGEKLNFEDLGSLIQSLSIKYQLDEKVLNLFLGACITEDATDPSITYINEHGLEEAMDEVRAYMYDNNSSTINPDKIQTYLASTENVLET